MNQNTLIGVPSTEYELWENASQSIIVLRKSDSLGRMTEEKVPGGRNVQITPGERRHNQEQCASVALDVFSNGMMRPVRLIDAETDSAELQANVNAMSDTAMRDLFKTPLRAFTTKVNEIGNPIALQHLLSLAQEESVEATVKKVEAITARLNEVRPPLGDVSITNGAVSTQAPRTEGSLRAITPR